jgi:Tfp pilus assembly protein PilF
VQALYGLGGVGKTQLAVEYAHRHRDDYNIVWWLRAEETANVWLDYAALARALKLPIPRDTPLENVRLELRRHLESRSDYLLIFDNASNPAVLRDFIPTMGAQPGRKTGHVIITSRNANWGSVARSFPLHGLSRDQSVVYLRKRAGRLDSEATAKRLAQALGDLPLALEQAASLIHHARLTFADYLKRFETHWAQLLKEQAPGGDYPDAVAMTWELSIRHVEQQNPTAITLLNLLAFLSPDGIPRRLLCDNFSQLPENLSAVCADPLFLDRSLGTLAQYSLVELSEDSGEWSPGNRQIISMHRLVAAIARDRLSEDERRVWSSVAARLIANVFTFDSNNPATWPAAATLLPHGLVAATHTQASGAPVELTCSLLDQAGRFLNRFAQYDQAKVLFDRALTLTRRAYGDESPRVSAIANNLGRVLTRLGQGDLAQQHFEWALAIDRNTYGDEDPHVATVMNNYALVLHATGKLDSARHHFESALAIFEAHYGPEHPKVATLLNNLGYIHLTSGDHQSAHDLFHRALSIGQAALGADHPTIASIHHNLGSALQSLGHPLLARDHYERALVIDQAAYGETHPDVARDCTSLATLMRQTGDPAAAQRYESRAATIRQALSNSKNFQPETTLATIES